MSHVREAMGKVPSPELIEIIRKGWRNDGADGETIHMLCDAVEALKAEVQRLTIPSERDTLPALEEVISRSRAASSPPGSWEEIEDPITGETLYRPKVV